MILLFKAKLPKAEFLCPVVLFTSVKDPKALLQQAVVVDFKASVPIALF